MIKKILLSLLVLLSVAGVFAAEDLDVALTRVGVDVERNAAQAKILCILDFSAGKPTMGTYIRDKLTEQVTENGRIRVVTRNDMDKVDAELVYQLSGVVSDKTALSICERLGAQAIVFGQLEELDNNYTLQVKMLEVETAAYALFKTYAVSRSSKTEQLLGRAAIYYKTAFGATIGINKNSIEFIAPAGGITFDYSFARRFSAGLKVLVSYDAKERDNSVTTVEPLGAVRFYTVSPTGEPSAGLFIEGQGGVTLLFVNDKTHVVPSAGLSLGFRHAMRNVYLEPYLRGGYPYLFGVGLNVGFRF